MKVKRWKLLKKRTIALRIGVFLFFVGILGWNSLQTYAALGGIAPSGFGVGGRSMGFERVETPLTEKILVREQHHLAKFKKLKERVSLTTDVTLKYDDNYLRAEDSDTKQEMSSTQRVEGTFLVLLIERQNLLKSLKMGPAFSMTRFLSSANSTDNEMTFQAAPFISWRGALGDSRLKWDLSEDLTPQFGTAVQTAQRKPVLSQKHAFESKWAYLFGQYLTVALPYRNEIIRYFDKDFEEGNITSHTFAPEFSRSFETNRTRIFTQSGMTKKSFKDQTKDAKLKNLQVGVQRRLGHKTEVSAQGGFAAQKTISTGSEIKTYVYNLTFSHPLTAKIALAINANRGITESLTVADGITAVTTESEALQEDNPTVIRTGYAARLTYTLSPKWTSLVSAGYTNEAQDQDDESSTGLYFGTLSFLYALSPAIHLSFNFQHSSQSADDTASFTQNIATVNLAWKVF